MKNNSMHTTTPRQRGRGSTQVLAAATMTAAALAFLAGCSSKAEDAPKAAATPSNVTLTAAQRQHIQLYAVEAATFHKSIQASGTVDFDNDQATSVLAPFSGPVTRLLVSPGDHVNKGDPLALVASADFAAAVSAYRKALVTARTARKVADADKDMVQHNGVSAREEEQAQTDAASAEADSEAALQALVSMQVSPQAIKAVEQGKSLARIEGMIRSPISGTVVERLITPGQLLQAGSTPCFSVADLSRVWVIAQIFGADPGAVRLGDTAEIDAGAGKTIPGKVTNIAGLVDPVTRAVGVRVAVDNPDGLLKKQMYVRVQIQSQQESSGLMVPVSAILRDDETLPFVYVSRPDGSFARQRVTLGYRSGDRYEVADGLKAADQVVVDGGIFVQFMQSQ